MDQSTRIVSGGWVGKSCLFSHPTLRCTVWSFQERFVSNLAAEVDRINNWKWNSDHVIVFQTVILQLVQLVTDTRYIHVQIDAQLNSWNSGAFDEIVCDSYAVSTECLGSASGNKSADQNHCTLSNLFLLGKLCEAYIFVCELELRAVLLTNKKASCKTGVTEKTVAMVLAKKTPPPPPILLWRCTKKGRFLFPWISWRMW